jgi:serine/threonine protein phosphatase PrpC
MNGSARIQIHAFACSDVGRVRSGNEDSFFVADLSEGVRIEKNGVLHFRSGSLGALFAVADGMGGAAAGEVASRLCLRTVYREIQELIREVRPMDLNLAQEILIEAVGSANSRVYELATHDHDYAGMGTTMTAALELQGQLVIGHIGDSRAYLLRGDQIRQLTRDQSLVGQMVSEGQITEEEGRRRAERNILLQAVGVRPTVELSLRNLSLRAGDVVLLCSDGLHSQMSGDEIYNVVAQSASPGDACLALVDLANERGGPDNITTVLVQFLTD